jgi:hypothetical protein
MPDDLPGTTGKNKFSEKEDKEGGQAGKRAFLSNRRQIARVWISPRLI